MMDPGSRPSISRGLGRGHSDQTPLSALAAVAFAVGAVAAVVVLTALVAWMLSG